MKKRVIKRILISIPLVLFAAYIVRVCSGEWMKKENRVSEVCYDGTQIVGFKYNGEEYCILDDKSSFLNEEFFHLKGYYSYPYCINDKNEEERIYLFSLERFLNLFTPWDCVLYGVKDDSENFIWFDESYYGHYIKRGFEFPTFDKNEVAALKLMFYPELSKPDIRITEKHLINEILERVVNGENLLDIVKKIDGYDITEKGFIDIEYAGYPMCETIASVEENSGEVVGIGRFDEKINRDESPWWINYYNEHPEKALAYEERKQKELEDEERAEENAEKNAGEQNTAAAS